MTESTPDRDRGTTRLASVEDGDERAEVVPAEARAWHGWVPNTARAVTVARPTYVGIAPDRGILAT